MSIRDYDTKHTIAAIATFPTTAALGIIKVSGKDALSVVHRIFLPKNKNKNIKKVRSYTLHYGWIIQPSNGRANTPKTKRGLKIIDEVLISVMRAPHSYTREDVVEISSHGGILILDKILDLILKGGARFAKPGEFSYRAFLNGRLDLIQLQAISDIVETKTEKTLFSLSRQLKGDFSNSIIVIKDELKNISSLLEACINFPDEDINMDLPKIKSMLKKIAERIKRILDNRSISRTLHEGARCVICGKANVGKSTLFNRILKEERAIVTRIPGTTRDTIEEIVNIKGVPLHIYDTAGILETKDFINKSAVSKTYKKIEEADLIIFIFDSSRRIDDKDLSLLDKIKDKNAIVVLNKIDLTLRVGSAQLKHIKKPLVKISALKGTGMDRLEEAIFNAIYKKGLGRENNLVVLAQWQAQVLGDILLHLNEAEKFIDKGFTVDFVSFAIKNALDDLSKLSGEKIDEDILNRIFSNFCIGK